MFMENYATKCHAIEVTIVLVLGSLPGAIIAGTSGYQIDRFPPDLCVPIDPNVFFHTFTLPIAIGATIGLSMLLTTFWILRRVSVQYFFDMSCSHTVCRYTYVFNVSYSKTTLVKTVY